MEARRGCPAGGRWGAADGPLTGAGGGVEEVEDVGVLGDLLGLVGVDRHEVVGEVGGCNAGPAGRPVPMWCSSTGPDQLLTASRSAYQSREVGSWSWSSRVQTWPHGNFPTGHWEIASGSRQAGKNARMYCRLVADKPFMLETPGAGSSEGLGGAVQC